MTNRRHMGVGYHHNGILAMSAIGLVLLYVDYRLVGTHGTEILISVICVGAIMLLQLIIDYRIYEKDYIYHTTDQQGKSGINDIKKRIKYKWPVLLIIPLFGIFQPLSIAGSFFLLMIMTYPLQRKMYLRSLKEFGSYEDSTT